MPSPRASQRRWRRPSASREGFQPLDTFGIIAFPACCVANAARETARCRGGPTSMRPSESREPTMSEKIALERRHGARNYDPLPIVLSRGEGVWLWDDQGRRYLDMLSAYS